MRSYILYIAPKIFYRANFKNKVKTAGMDGRNKFQRPESENICYVHKLHRFVLFFCFVHKFQNANCFF